MTIEKCASLCSDYTFYGLEYGGECYCGNTIDHGAFKFVDQSVCNMACKGNSEEICGGNSALNIYGPPQTEPEVVVPSFTYVGCFDDSGARVFNQRYSSEHSMTHDYCFQTCTLAGFTYAGLEWGKECWCGNSVLRIAHQLLDGACSQPCSGDASETCGNAVTLQLYVAS
jgi:hypothetical protein